VAAADNREPTTTPGAAQAKRKQKSIRCDGRITARSTNRNQLACGPAEQEKNRAEKREAGENQFSAREQEPKREMKIASGSRLLAQQIHWSAVRSRAEGTARKTQLADTENKRQLQTGRTAGKKRPRMKLSRGPNRASEPRAARAATKNNGSDQQNEISETHKKIAQI
jgi:hypothetical protein